MRNKPGAMCYSSILILVLFLGMPCSFFAEAQNEYYHEEFNWNFKGNEWTWSLDIPKYFYESYRSVPVSTRTQNGLAGYGFLTTTNDYYLRMVAEKLQNAALQQNYESYDEVSFVLAFVQSLPYTSDSVTSGFDEYPRFPLETLVDNGGDCEDTAILFATLTLIMGYGTVYISPPNHYAVGVLGSDLIGLYYTYEDKNYYYCETTGDGWEIGQIPSEYRNIEAYIYEINEYQQYDPTKPEASNITNLVIAIFETILVVATIAIVLVTLKRRQNQVQASNAVHQSETESDKPLPFSEISRFCRYCGSKTPTDAVFCEKCGKQLK